MIPNQISKKQEQLRFLIRHYQSIVKDSKKYTSEYIQRVIAKIKHLILDLSQVLSIRKIKRIIGGTAFVLSIGLSQEASAQQFAAPLINPFGLDSTYQFGLATMADLDNDGDWDLLFGEYYGAMHYFENRGTPENPLFDTLQINPFGISNVTEYSFFPEFVDIDNDGDFDLITGGGGYYFPEIRFFENIGNQTAPEFAEPLINPFSLNIQNSYIAIPAFADLDADGDYDVVFQTYYEYFTEFFYYENIGTPEVPSFIYQDNNPLGLDSLQEIAIPEFADIDGDGDQDLIIGEYYGAIKFFENIGTANNPLFDHGQVNPFGIDSVYYIGSPVFGDMDNDGDLDMFVSEVYGAVKYYENTSITSNKDQVLVDACTIWPNPVREELYVRIEQDVISLEIINQKGFSIKQLHKNTRKLNVQDLPPGIYVLKLNIGTDQVISKKFLKVE